MYSQFMMHGQKNIKISENYSNIKFHENRSSWSLVVPCRRTDGRTDTWHTDRQTYITNLIVAFCVLRRRLKATLRPELRMTAPKTVSVPYEAGYRCKCFGRH